MKFDYASAPFQEEIPALEGSIDEFIAKQEKITEEKKEKQYSPSTSSSSYHSAIYRSRSSEKNQAYLPTPEYGEKLAFQREDVSHNIPLKFVNIEAKSSMGGVLGYVYPGDSKITLREDLAGSGSSLAKEVDIHECIHTPVGDEWGEYETRLLSRWMMEKPKIKYKK